MTGKNNENEGARNGIKAAAPIIPFILHENPLYPTCDMVFFFKTHQCGRDRVR